MQPSLSSPFWEGVGESTKEEDLARKRAWRASPEHVEGLRSLVYKYLGTHNFHNFTVGRDFNDRSNFRYMKKIEVSARPSLSLRLLVQEDSYRYRILWFMVTRNGSVCYSMDRASCFIRCAQMYLLYMPLLTKCSTDCETYLASESIVGINGFDSVK